MRKLRLKFIAIGLISLFMFSCSSSVNDNANNSNGDENNNENNNNENNNNENNKKPPCLKQGVSHEIFSTEIFVHN